MCIRIDSLAKQNVLQEGLTREILARHSCLHPVLTLRIPACASHMSHFAGCLVTRYPRKLFNLQLLEFLHSLFIRQPLHSNPTINTGYKRLNRITIKFGTKLKPTKHIVVNHNFTIMFICKHWIFTVPCKEMTLTMKKQWMKCLTTKKIGRVKGGKNFLLEKYYCLHSFLQLHRQIYTSLTKPKPIALFINWSFTTKITILTNSLAF